MASLVRGREGRLALCLAAAAALRVFLFSSAFPFFTNVDEHRHVDAVFKYSRGYLPRPDTAAYEPDMPTYLGYYGSPEYHIRPEQREGRGVPPPPWEVRGDVDRLVEFNERYLADRPNLEAYQPPVYYALAGGWVALGRAAGLSGGTLLYWMRQLNAVFAFVLVLATYLFLRDLYPEDALLRLGVPALLVAFPLDTVYYTTPDALSPLVVGVGFFLSVRVALGSPGGAPAHVATGLVVAAAVLTKYTNVALVPVCALATALALAHRPDARRLRGEGGRLLLLWAAFALPVGLWLLRNQLLFDDPAGTSLKLERLGWGRKTFAEWWDHPLFTPSGFGWWVKELVPMFWRGEIVWSRVILSSHAADLFYNATTFVFLPLAALGLARRAGSPRVAEGLALGEVVAAAAVLAWLSLLFVFGEKTNPTAERPFFFHGRLISGAMAPFALAWVRGLQVSTTPLPAGARRAAGFAGLAIALCVVLASEVWISRTVFASAYNWFALP